MKYFNLIFGVAMICFFTGVYAANVGESYSGGVYTIKGLVSIFGAMSGIFISGIFAGRSLSK